MHEWVEGRPAALSPAHHGAVADVAVLDELAARRRRYERAAKPAQGPPHDDSFAAPQPTTPTLPVWSAGATEPGTAEDPITWLFDPESFAPMAKLVGDARYAIVTDHLGTPTAMYDATGAEVWSATIDAYGDLRNITGTRTACPFRWPGQYEDAETGLYYNRFRYYDASQGHYLSPDPLGLLGGPVLAGYVSDPLTQTDPFGLITILDAIRDQSPKSIPNTATVHGPTIKSGGGVALPPYRMALAGGRLQVVSPFPRTHRRCNCSRRPSSSLDHHKDSSRTRSHSARV